MDNPLLAPSGLPDFAAIRAGHVEPAVDAVVARHRATLESLVAQDAPTFASLIEPFEDASHALSRVWNAVQHLNSVLDGDGFRAAYNNCRVLLADYHAEVGQNEALYGAFGSIVVLLLWAYRVGIGVLLGGAFAAEAGARHRAEEEAWNG